MGSLLGFDPWGWAAFGPLKWALASVLVLAGLAFLLLSGLVVIHRVSFWIWLLFLAMAAASSLSGLDPFYAWFGTPDRHLGWMTLVFFGIAFVIGQNAYSRIHLITRAAVLSAIGIGVYCLLEWAGRPPIDLVAISERWGGTFGSPAYLGAACVLVIPIAAAIALDPSERVAWRLAAGIGATLATVAIIGSQTRGALVGLIAAALFALPAWWRRLARRRVFALVAAIGLILVVSLSPMRPRVWGLFEGDMRARVDEWRMGVLVLAKYPVLGTGPEGYRIAFPGVVDADYERRYGRQVMPDRAHNGALDAGVSLGIPGLTFYGLAAGFLVLRAGRGVRSDALAVIGLGAAAVGYLVQQQFLFPVAEIDPVFWLVAGLLVAATNSSEPSRRKVPRWTATLATTLAAVALLAGSLDVAADHRVLAAYRYLDPATADFATRFRPDSIRYWFVASDITARRGDEQALVEGVIRIEHALELSPADPTLRSRRAHLFLALAEQTGDSSDIAAAVAEYDLLAVEDPVNAQNWLRAGTAYALSGDFSLAERALNIAQDLAPNSAVPSANLARVLLAAGEPRQALAAYKRAVEIDPGLPDLVEIALLLGQSGVSAAER